MKDQKTKITNSKGISFIGAAISEGQKLQGVNLGPQALRESGLFKSLQNKFKVNVIDYGNIECGDYKHYLHDSLTQDVKNHHVHNLGLLDLTLHQISKRSTKALTQHPQNIVLTIGGDHSVGTGSIHGLLGKFPDLKVIWVDAHPDFIDSTKSDYQGYHGMPLSHLTGVNRLPGFKWLDRKLPCENVVLIGIRDIDEDQWVSLKQNKIKCFTVDHIDMYGIGQVMTMALEYLDPKGNSPFHISFDIDSIDPLLVGGTGTMFRDGLTHRQATHIIRRTAHQRKLVGMDVVEINPQMDTTHRKSFRGEDDIIKVNQTVGAGIDLIESVFTQHLTL